MADFDESLLSDVQSAASVIRLVEQMRTCGINPSAVVLPLRFGPPSGVDQSMPVTFYGLPVRWVDSGPAQVIVDVG